MMLSQVVSWRARSLQITAKSMHLSQIIPRTGRIDLVDILMVVIIATIVMVDNKLGTTETIVRSSLIVTIHSESKVTARTITTKTIVVLLIGEV